MNIVITESAFYELLEREKRRIRISRNSDTVKWLDSFQGLISSRYVPFTNKIIKELHGGEVNMQSFHVTDFNKLKQFLNLLGKENALSSFKYMNKDTLGEMRGIQTEGGIMFLLNGVTVFNAPTDIMSKPDEFGRRWIHANYFGENIESKISNLLLDNKKYYKSSEYINEIINQKIKSGKISSSDVEKEKIRLVFRLLVQYQEDCYEIIKKYSDEPYIYQFQDDTRFSYSWSESLIQKVKIEKVLIGLFRLNNFENYKNIKRKNIDAITENDKLLVKKFEKQIDYYKDILKNYINEDKIYMAYHQNDVLKFVEDNGGYSDLEKYKEKEKIVFEKLSDLQKRKIVQQKLSRHTILTDSEFKYLNREYKIKYIEYKPILSINQFKSLDDELIKLYIIKLRNITGEQFNFLNDELQSYYIDILMIDKNYLKETDEGYIKDSVKRKYTIHKVKNGKRLSVGVLKTLDDELKKIYIENVQFSLIKEEIELFDKSLLQDFINRLIDKRISVCYDTYELFNEDQQLKYINLEYVLTDDMFKITTDNNKFIYLESRLKKYDKNLTELQLGFLDENQIIKYIETTLDIPETLIKKLNPANKFKYYELKINNRVRIYDYDFEYIFGNIDLLKKYIVIYKEISESKLDSLSPELFDYYISIKIENRKQLNLKEFKKCSEDNKIKYLTFVNVVLSDIYTEGENEKIIRLNVANKIKNSYELSDDEYLLLNDEQKGNYLRLRFRLTPKQIENTPESLLIEYSNDFHSKKTQLIPELFKYLNPDVVNLLIKRGVIDEKYVHLLSPESLILYYKNKIRRFERIPISELIKLPLEDQFFYFDRIEIIRDEDQISKLPQQTQDQLKLIKIKKGYDLSDEEFVSSGHDVKSHYIDKFYDRISKEKIATLSPDLKSKLVAKRYKGDADLSDEEFGYLDKKSKLSYLKRVEKTDEDFDKLDNTSKLGYLMDKLSKGKNLTQHQFDFLPKTFLQQILKVGVKTSSDVFSFLSDDEKLSLLKVKIKSSKQMEPHEKKWFDANKEKINLDEMINEEVFYYDDLSKEQKNKVYDLFKDAYIKSTGKAWSRDKFDIKASRWTFYGLKNEGFVAVRKQGGSLNKLNGSAGNLRGISVGMKDLIDSNEPLWGLSTFEIRNILTKKFGLISPPPMVARIILSLIPKSVFGGSITKINSDGSMTIDYDDVGTAKKYFFANKKYFQESIPKLMGISAEKSPIKMKIINAFLKTIL